MNTASSNILSSMNPNNFLEFYSYDAEEDELMRIMKILAGDTNLNESVYRPKKQVNHVGIQTVPEIDDKHIPWLVEAERKTAEFCVQLCNLKNSLYHSQNGDSKTKHKAAPSSSIPIIRNVQSGKYRPMHSFKSSGYTKLPGEKNKNVDHLIFDLIEDRINSVLKSAVDLQNSIPKLSLEKLDEYSEYEILESTTVKETSVLKLKRSSSSVNMRGLLPPKEYKRGNTLPTIKESKFNEKIQIREKSKHLSQISRGTGKSETCFIPKTKNVAKAQSTATGTSRQPFNVQAKEIGPKDLEVPTKDTGAIPKIRDACKKTSSSTTTRSQKTKKTDNKPLWR